MRMLRQLILLIGVLLAAAPLHAADSRWATAWATAAFAIDAKDQLDPAVLPDSTLRQTLLLTAGGDRLRIRITNRYGREPLQLSAVSVAQAPGAGSATIVGPGLPVSFSGQKQVTVPPGADYLSDPVALPAKPLQHLTVSMHIAGPVSPQTGHPGARTNAHFAPGRLVDAKTLAPATAIPRWFFLASVEVENSAAATIAILGDSITDGYGVTPDSDGRWPDHLARRLQADPATQHLAVANLGIGGNRLLLDGLGPNGLARLDRDVLNLPGVTHLVLLLGVNDLGTLTRDAPATPEQHKALVQRIIAGYGQIALLARERGIRVIGATIMPYGGSGYYHPDQQNEADRQAINAWIRTPGNVDAVLDFDAATRDPAQPAKLRADLDSGDGLHPSAAGYRAMADAVPLTLFKQPAPQIVLTFDDLPEHGPLPAGTTAADVARSITETLKAHKVKVAYGFINGAKVERSPALAEPLRIWTAAGYPLANHGWSHARLDDLTPQKFSEEVRRNEKLLAGAPRYFRYPFLAEGADPALRDAARAELAKRGYSIAPVSMDFADWAFNGAYARCAARNDTNAIARLEQTFMAYAEVAALYARANADKLYGRDIPHVLLLHSGAFTARMLPQLLTLYEKLGFEYASLEAALQDSAYATARNPALPFESTTVAARPGALSKPSGIPLGDFCQP